MHYEQSSVPREFSVSLNLEKIPTKLTLSFLNECFLLSTGFGDFKVKGYRLDFPVSSYVFPSYIPAADLFSAPICAPGTNLPITEAHYKSLDPLSSHQTVMSTHVGSA